MVMADPRSLHPRDVPTSEPGMADLDLRPGAVVCEQWRVERELGRGGFGVVFAARDLHLGDTHALKVLDPTLAAKDKIVERFRREVLVMRKLTHPHVARVFDYREDPDRHLALISMEYIPGPSLRELIALAKREGKQIPIPVALAILAQTLAALEAAHEQGVIHRDVKPGNILLAGGGLGALLGNREEGPQVKLVDFGIASLLDRSGTYQHSRPLGTVAYAAPELLTDPPAQVTTAADVYGAGAVAYELLTRELPLGHGSPPSQLCTEAPHGLDEFLFRLLHRWAPARPTASAARPEAEALRAAALDGQHRGARPQPAASQDAGDEAGRSTARPARWLSRQLLPLLLVLSVAVILGPGGGNLPSAPTSADPPSEADAAPWVAGGSHLSGAAVRSVVIDPRDPDTIYAGTAAGEVFRSTNGGEQWDCVTRDLLRKRIHALAVDPRSPGILYAGTAGGVFQSTDGGTRWQALSLSVRRRHVHCLAIDPRNPGILYAGAAGGVFKTTNGGGSWKAAHRGISKSNVTALAIDSARSAVYAGTTNGVFKSTDGGDRWRLVETGLSEKFVQSLAIDPGPPSVLYAGTWGGGVFASTDGGESWTGFNSGLVEESVSKVFALAVDPGPPSTLYAGTSRGIYTHTTADRAWVRLSCNPRGKHKDILALAIGSMPSPTLYAGTRDGLYQCEKSDRRRR